MNDQWETIKTKGSNHYKISPSQVEPIDLYKSGGILRHFAIGNIIKYAYRNREGDLSVKDLDKIIHYTEMLIFLAKEESHEI